ncbi:MAG: L-threonylcarbamoyladenylate synthase [Halieaceae bacterium]|jgi:L-threonylcarbamoyladenylate synthase|nr:L-threonylcarbamoyladenylate synthase [Halieaceae bacterium]
MKTQILTVDPLNPDSEAIAAAARLLRAGELVAFPTETVYGLGANAMDAAALGRIFTAKQRPRSDPIIAHIASLDQLPELTRDLPDAVHELAAEFWPGPLTFILKRSPAVPDAIAEGRDTIAVRMPAHSVAHALLKAAQIPVGAPSANTFTRPSATTAAHVDEDLGGRIAMILDGGPTTIGLESTVLDLTGPSPRVMRPGGVTLEALREKLPGVEFAPSYVSEADGSASPGQMLKHYSPRATVRLYRSDRPAEALRAMARDAAEATAQGLSVGALVCDEDAAALGAVAVETLGPQDDLEALGRRLFIGLRQLDARGADLILVRDPGRAGLGAALWDRLLRAAEGVVIDC